MLFMGIDYSEGAAPEILDALIRTNMEQSVGYGMDEHCENARKLICEAIECESADVHFTVGGTQTNATVIASMLRPFEAVISPETGHICLHETGAIEGTGHKVIHMPSEDGKLRPEQIDEAVAFHEDEHFVKPRMVYISQPTEQGTLYSKAELVAIKERCERHGLYLYIDGARLAVGLTTKGCDLKLSDMPKLCDVFYIGGTKNGLLFGEAIVIVNESLKPDFRFMIKHCGAMLAKGRLLGVQFEEAFGNKGELWFKYGQHASDMAEKLREGIRALGYEFAPPAPTNQIFVKLSNAQIEELGKECVYEPWLVLDEDHRSIRFCTSWATPESDIDALLAILERIK